MFCWRGRKEQVIKRLAILLAAEEAVAAYHETLEHPSPEAERHLRACFELLILRVAVWQRDELPIADPIPEAIVGSDAEGHRDLSDRSLPAFTGR